VKHGIASRFGSGLPSIKRQVMVDEVAGQRIDLPERRGVAFFRGSRRSRGISG
jgi:hypothetical protein